MGCARSHNLVGHGQRLADVVQHEVRVDALRRGVVDELRGPHEFFRKQRIKDKYGEISNWDTSRVTDMFCMFQFAHSFNQPLNKWNVSNVRRMDDMFDSVGGSFAARWARMVLKRCSSERGEREKRFYGGGKDERRRTAF